MSTCVLDASALVALVFAEPGAPRVADLIAEGAGVSAVNISELAAILVRRALPLDEVVGPVVDQVDLYDFTLADALQAARLQPETRSAGLSLGDRACLALALRLEVRAVTSDRAWLGVAALPEIECLR